MEDQFEKYVKSHSNEMDGLNLPQDAWEGIQKLRGKSEPVKKKPALVYLSALRRVAAVFVLALAGYGLFSLATQSGSNKTAQLPKEIREMDEYYEAQFSKSMEELNRKYPENELVSVDLSSEFEMLEEEKEKLIEELKLNYANQKVLEELIEVYRLRLEMLEDVLRTLNEENEKDYDDENSFNT